MISECFKFIYYKSMIYKLTNLFCNTNLRITSHTNNTIHNILHNRAHDTNTHAYSGIYQLKCHIQPLIYGPN